MPRPWSAPKDVSELIALIESGELTDRLARQVLLGASTARARRPRLSSRAGLKVVSDDTR